MAETCFDINMIIPDIFHLYVNKFPTNTSARRFKKVSKTCFYKLTIAEKKPLKTKNAKKYFIRNEIHPHPSGDRC